MWRIRSVKHKKSYTNKNKAVMKRLVIIIFIIAGCKSSTVTQKPISYVEWSAIKLEAKT